MYQMTTSPNIWEILENKLWHDTFLPRAFFIGTSSRARAWVVQTAYSSTNPSLDKDFLHQQLAFADSHKVLRHGRQFGNPWIALGSFSVGLDKPPRIFRVYM